MAEIEGERNRMLSELRGQIVSLAVAAAQKLLADNLDERRQQVLVNEFFSGVRSGSVTILDAADLDGDNSSLRKSPALFRLPMKSRTLSGEIFLTKWVGRRPLVSASIRLFSAGWWSGWATGWWMVLCPASSRICARTSTRLSLY